MNNTLRSDPIVRFILAAFILFLFWYLLYELVIHPWGKLDEAIIDNLIWAAGMVLQMMGHELLTEPINVEQIRTIGIQGGHLLWIGDPCNGLGLFAVFTLFMLAYPGSWIKKGWFIPAGLLSIHIINTLRIVALCILVSIDYELLNFNHDYTFYVIVYGWVFFLWWLWATRLSKLRASA